MFGAINSLFSGLALAGVIYTIHLQKNELSLQRKELKLNRRELKLQREELGRTSASQLRHLHIELLKMSMTDSDLAKVWESDKSLNRVQSKQHSFVNLILSHWEMLFQQGILDENQLRTLLKEHFRKPHFQKFWVKTRDIRRKFLSASSDEKAIVFHELADATYEALKN